MSDPVVELQSGLARGAIEKHEDGFDYYAFRGIPYGELPVGELRFKDPVPKKKWSGTLDCTNYGPLSLQYDPFFNVTSTSEDSLHLNVFTRAINDENAKLPVIVFVHGGAFIFGTSCDSIYGPDYLIRQNVVLVTISYRLGVLGFLNLEDDVAPGNQGLKDVLLGFQWVQQNIRVFGGDPSNVTAFGLTSGGVLVNYLALSPSSEGLMHKVILQAASVYSPWTRVKNAKSSAIMLCSLLGKELSDSKEILEFLTSVDVEQLQRAQEQLRVSVDYMPFVPGPDPGSSSPIMPVDIEVAAARGLHLPCIIGANSREAKLLLARASKQQMFESIDRDFSLVFRQNTKDILTRYDLSVDQLRRLYYKGESVSERNTDKFIDLASDLLQIEGVQRLARIQAERGSASTYYYVFSYASPASLTNLMNSDLPEGAGHFDDLPFLFKMRALESLGGQHPRKGTQEYRMMERMTQMYANFARYGRPTIETNELIPVHWLPIDDGTIIRYLNLDEDLTMQYMVNVDRKFAAAKDIRV